jgi:hypothetical protein
MFPYLMDPTIAIGMHACDFFLKKSIDSWQIVETGWTPLETTIAELNIPQTHDRVVNDKAMNAICQAFSPSEFSRISHCETAKEA